MASGGLSSSRCAGLPLSRLLLLRSTGSRRAGSVVVAHGPSCSVACGIFPDQGSNLCPLHWQADSQPLRHQGSPIHFFLKFLFIYLFIYGCVGSSFLREGPLQLWQAGAALHRGAQASHYRGLSCCGAQAPDAQAQQLWLTGPAAPQHAGSSQTGTRTRVPCIGRQTPNHCAAREAPHTFLSLQIVGIKYIHHVNKDLLYSTGTYTRYSVITYKAKESKKE